MGNKETTKLILNRRRNREQYHSYADKKAYYDAIAAGDSYAINELSAENYMYPSIVFEQSDSYSDAMYHMYYDVVCAASEMCLVAIQNGLPDMVAYDIRDNYMVEFDRAMSLPDLYDLLHGMAHEFAVRVRYTRLGGIHSARLNAMMTYIEKHLKDKITLEDVAEVAQISRNYASTVFRDELGMTMNEFILQERVAEAKRLLADNRLQISEIAEQLQFCSQSYFTKCFTRVTGNTPNEYRTNVCFLK
ncbi:MAG: helix-turn-helix transcriptional regulator [Clostridiales bacterium]|nr:helix-turn-helix transcriptional regulator [Candidatus Crickella equi]